MSIDANVGILSIVFMVFSLILSLFVPLLVVIIGLITKKIKGIPLLVGMLVFFVMQSLIRMNALNLLYAVWGQEASVFLNTNPIGIFLLSLSAGIFEEFGRFAAFALLLKKRRSFADGVSYGIGHGGFEAVTIVGLTYVINIILTIFINTGVLDSIMYSMPEMLRSQLEGSAAMLMYVEPPYFLMAGFERIFAMCFHVAMSVLVLYAVKNKKFPLVLLAVGLHTFLNFSAVPIMRINDYLGYALPQFLTPVLSEIFLLVCAAGSVIFVIIMRKKFNDKPAMAAYTPAQTGVNNV